MLEMWFSREDSGDEDESHNPPIAGGTSSRVAIVLLAGLLATCVRSRRGSIPALPIPCLSGWHHLMRPNVLEPAGGKPVRSL